MIDGEWAYQTMLDYWEKISEVFPPRPAGRCLCYSDPTEPPSLSILGSANNDAEYLSAKHFPHPPPPEFQRELLWFYKYSGAGGGYNTEFHTVALNGPVINNHADEIIRSVLGEEVTHAATARGDGIIAIPTILIASLDFRTSKTQRLVRKNINRIDVPFLRMNIDEFLGQIGEAYLTGINSTTMSGEEHVLKPLRTGTSSWLKSRLSSSKRRNWESEIQSILSYIPQIAAHYHLEDNNFDATRFLDQNFGLNSMSAKMVWQKYCLPILKETQ